MTDIGKSLIIIGIGIIILGMLLFFSGKLPFNLGKLPGDIFYKKGNFSFYFPLTTTIVVSIVLSLLIYLFGRFFR